MNRKYSFRFLFLSLGLLFVLARGSCAAGQVGEGAFPRSFLHEAQRYPDLTQTDVRAGLPWGGWFHCGPVAVSNGLIWFRERGVEIGPSPSGDSFADQVEIARSLGAPRYMDTGLTSHGTTVSDFLEGLERYLADYSRESFSIRYMGWATHPERFSTGLRAPDFDQVCRSVARGGAVFLDLGWYLFGERSGAYRRNGGHWVTLVGYDWPVGERFPRLHVHDPAPWSGKDRRTHLVTLGPAGKKPFSTRSGMRIGSLEPYLRIEGGLRFKRGTELALIEGAVILYPEVEPAVPWIDGCGSGRKGFVSLRQ